MPHKENKTADHKEERAKGQQTDQASVDVDTLIEQAISALEAEIKTVQERPSSDVLYNGSRVQSTSDAVRVQTSGAAGSASSKGSAEGADFRFECHQSNIRFAEEIQATDGKKEWVVTPVSWEKGEVILRFPESPGDAIKELQVEWENDFVLKRTLRELERLESVEEASERIRLLFEPDVGELPVKSEPLDDGMRNSAQYRAIEQALRRRTLFIWGPPGTGKTATLGYIIANYLNRGKSVLFVSNTNRAVDVGLLSTLDAIEKAGIEVERHQLTRFGEPALDDERIHELSFEEQVEELLRRRQAGASEFAGLLARQEEVKKAAAERLRKGKKPTPNQNLEMELVESKIRQHGGREALEEKVEELMHVNERIELKRKQLVATTLAKICTSDLFFDLEFDAVVIDEGSMASLPYLMVAASRARWHRVVVGDPMQLPPIALTGDREARELLESDIFTRVSGADSTQSLFEWHDQHPDYTSFFDTQYRLEASLADVISTVFYEGRLKSSGEGDNGLDSQPETASAGNGPTSRRSYHLIDTSRRRPVLTQKRGERGFQPVNEVHQQVIRRLISNMLGKGIQPEEIGVMVPFRSVVYDLRTLLYEASIRDVEVGTIHTFQGREKPYIIFDTVMSGEGGNGPVRHYSVRPLDEEKNGLTVPRLLNVAFSRSQNELMILADMRHIRQVYGNKFLGRLLERMRH